MAEPNIHDRRRWAEEDRLARLEKDIHDVAEYFRKDGRVVARGGIDPDAFKAATAAVQKLLDELSGSPTTHPGEQAEALAEEAINAYMDDIVRQLDLSPCVDCKEDQVKTETESQRRIVPDSRNGNNVIVLGSREGNIGGAIAERLSRSGYVTQEDDCLRSYEVYEGLGTRYEAPARDVLSDYDVCVITLGTTHMEPFSTVSAANMRKVLRGSLELPLECARRYVQARKEWAAEVGGGLHHYPGAPGYDPENPGECYTSDCLYDCGAWAGPSRSGARIGSDVDPFGPCPKSPKTTDVGTIIFIGSYAHDHPFTHCTTYCTAKAGLDMAARSLAWELIPEGFDVHIIHPHHVQGTPMTDEVVRGMMKGVHKMSSKEAYEYQRKDLRMPDLLKPEEIAELVLIILETPVLRWMNGQGWNMYGGVR